MSEIKFNDNQSVIDVQSTATPVDGVRVDSVNGHVEPAPSYPPPALSDNGFLTGDLPGFRDIILPRLNIVQGAGELKDSFPQGSIVFNQSLEVFRLPVIDKPTGNVKVPGTPPANITIIGFRPTRFVEKVIGGIRGLIVNTEEQVRAAGGTLDWSEWNMKKAQGMKRFEPLAEAFVVIRRPDHVADDDTVFTYSIDDAKYTLALWGMKGTSYTAAAKRVFFPALRMGCLSKGGYPSWSFNLSTLPKTTEGNTYYVPVAVPCRPSTGAMLDFVRNILNPAAEA